ncbi:MAG: CPBP family intramembrane glutamic endopeptidase [Pirellulales bacterium]
MTTELNQPFEDDVAEGPLEIAPAAAPGRPLAVWPVFAIYVLGLVACVVAQIPIVLAVIAYQVATGGKPADILDFIQTPVGFIVLASGSQLALLATWWLASTFGDQRIRRHRAIGRTTLSASTYVCFALATLAVLLLGDPLAQMGSWLFGEWQNDQIFAGLYDHMTWPSGIAFVVFIAVAPGFVEELFFRGYLQRRLLDRWSPAVGVPVIAVLFAASHGTPAWALAVLPLALWLGILAWRTGSLWPGIVCHGFINGSVNLWRVGAGLGAWPSELAPTAYYAAVAASLACLLASVWLLFKYQGDSSQRADI